MSHLEFDDVTSDYKRKRADSWSSRPSIVYDSIEGRLYRAPEVDTLAYTKVIIPGKSTKADIYLEIDRGEVDLDAKGAKTANVKAKAWLARVDLGSLGWTARWKRHMGEINHIYIKKGN